MKKFSSIGATKASYDELESMRGIAAMLVLLCHIPAWNLALYHFPLIRFGGVMVDLFFVLSGFIICLAYSEKIRSPKDLLAFQFLRLGRLYPVHVLFLAVFLLIEWARSRGAAAAGVVRMNAAEYASPTLGDFFQHLFMVQAMPPFGQIHTFNAPSWSIGVEFYTYLIFGVLILFARKRLLYILPAIHAVTAALLLIGLDDRYVWLVRCLCGFSLGAWLNLYMASACRRNAMPVFASWVSEILFFLIIGTVWLAEQFSHAGLLMMWLTAMFIPASLGRSGVGPIATILRTKQFVWLGTMSFTFYMAHSAVIWFVNQLARFVLRWPEAMVEGSFKPQGGLLASTALTVFTVCLTLFVSFLVKRTVEDPARAWFRQASTKFVRTASSEGLARKSEDATSPN